MTASSLCNVASLNVNVFKRSQLQRPLFRAPRRIRRNLSINRAHKPILLLDNGELGGLPRKHLLPTLRSIQAIESHHGSILGKDKVGLCWRHGFDLRDGRTGIDMLPALRPLKAPLGNSSAVGIQNPGG